MNNKQLLLAISNSLSKSEAISFARTMDGGDKWYITHVHENPKAINIENNGRFFLGYAFAWMINTHTEEIASQVKSVVHSPVKFRVIGSLADIPEF